MNDDVRWLYEKFLLNCIPLFVLNLIFDHFFSQKNVAV